MRNRFPKVACPGCQQLRDGHELFRIIELMCGREHITHDRMRNALVRLAAMWGVTSLAMDPEAQTIDGSILQLIESFALATREAANRGRTNGVPVSPQFAAETEALLSKADARRHAH
jgi:hypothetical protein